MPRRRTRNPSEAYTRAFDFDAEADKLLARHDWREAMGQAERLYRIDARWRPLLDVLKRRAPAGVYTAPTRRRRKRNQPPHTMGPHPRYFIATGRPDKDCRGDWVSYNFKTQAARTKWINAAPFCRSVADARYFSGWDELVPYPGARKGNAPRSSPPARDWEKEICHQCGATYGEHIEQKTTDKRICPTGSGYFQGSRVFRNPPRRRARKRGRLQVVGPPGTRTTVMCARCRGARGPVLADRCKKCHCVKCAHFMRARSHICRSCSP